MPGIPPWSFVAPDAAHVAYFARAENGFAACAFDLASETETCVDRPAAAGNNFTAASLPPAVWAPDGERLAVAGIALQTFVDSDLTVVNSADGTATVLAPDKTDGTLVSAIRWAPDSSALLLWALDSVRGHQRALLFDAADTLRLAQE